MQELKELSVGALQPSPTNPRKNLGDITELVESVRTKGLIEPIVARPLNGRGTCEIVCGHRRAAAAKAAGLATVPVLVRELNDDQVLDLQLAENIDRADLSPLEEAEAYALRLERGQSVQHVADRIGRTPAYVAQRLKLLELPQEAREALASGELTLGVAQLIARIPNPKLQKEALNEFGPNPLEGCAGVREAREGIEHRYMLRLAEAQFDTADATLVPAAGPCTTCQKRTGNQTELFADVASPDLCTDPPCHKKKVDAEWSRRKKAAAKSGIQVLDDKESDKALHFGSSYSGWAKLDEKQYVGGKSRSIRSILGKDTPPTAIARDKWNGKIVELVKKADLDKALRAQGLLAKDERPSKTERSAQQKAADRKKKIRRAAIERVLALAEEAGGNVDQDAAFSLVVRSFAARVWSEVQRAILDRRKVPIDKKLGAEGTILAYASKLSGDELIGLGLELAMRSGAPWNDYAHDKTRTLWDEGLKLLGVDCKELEAKIADELKAKAKAGKSVAGQIAKAQKATRATRKAKASAEPAVDDFGNELADEVCRGCGCSELDPCPGGCAWAKPGLCTNCVGDKPKGRKAAPKGERERRKARIPGKPGSKGKARAATARA